MSKKHTKWTDEERKMVAEMVTAGKTDQQIARKIGRTSNAVSYAIQVMRSANGGDHPPRRRPKVIAKAKKAKRTSVDMNKVLHAARTLADAGCVDAFLIDACDVAINAKSIVITVPR